eukprot:scaffold32722_cov100-Isochrysis_galbana.AAC.2
MRVRSPGGEGTGCLWEEDTKMGEGACLRGKVPDLRGKGCAHTKRTSPWQAGASKSSERTSSVLTKFRGTRPSSVSCAAREARTHPSGDGTSVRSTSRSPSITDISSASDATNCASTEAMYRPLGRSLPAPEGEAGQAGWVALRTRRL